MVLTSILVIPCMYTHHYFKISWYISNTGYFVRCSFFWPRFFIVDTIGMHFPLLRVSSPNISKQLTVEFGKSLYYCSISRSIYMHLLYFYCFHVVFFCFHVVFSIFSTGYFFLLVGIFRVFIFTFCFYKALVWSKSFLCSIHFYGSPILAQSRMISISYRLDHVVFRPCYSV